MDQGFRHNDLNLADDAAQCLRQRRLPINPYQMPDGRGISFAVAAKNLMDASLDPGVSGGCLFVLLDHTQSLEDVAAVVELRNQEYDAYAGEKY